MFTTNKKPNTTVGLEIETGSIAATEVRAATARARSRGPRSRRSPPGVVNEGEVTGRRGARRARCARFFSKNKLGKSVRLGVANQRVVVRTLRLPLIEDDDELETAIRFQAQDHIPMPLDQAVLDHQVVAKETGARGRRARWTWSPSPPAATWSPRCSGRCARPACGRSGSTSPPSA